MAQTKRKRRSKHRGTAAGSVVTRGRTGRKPTAAESKQSSKDQAKARRLQRHDKPPTWKGAFQRGAIATGLFIVLTILAFRQSIAAALSLSVFVLGLYSVMGYYTDLMLYTRRQRRKLKVQAAAREVKARERDK